MPESIPTSSTPTSQPSSGGNVGFDERISVPWWWWPLALGIAGLLAAQFHMGYPGVRAWLPYVLAGIIAVGVLLWLGRHRIRVDAGELHVGRAHLPLRHIGEVVVIAPEHKQPVLGRDLDPAAFVVYRPWVGPLVRVALTDPNDPTPYWVVSSRRAETLAATLRGSA